MFDEIDKSIILFIIISAKNYNKTIILGTKVTPQRGFVFPNRETSF